MDEKNKEIIKKHLEKYKNEKPIDRVSRWVLGTIKWHYDIVYIIGSGAIDQDRTYGDKFKDLPKNHQDFLINTCTEAYKPFKKYLLIYVCYLFGACYENCKRNNIKFEPTESFLQKQLESFFSMTEKFYKKPDKESNIWNPGFDNLFNKKDLNVNKNFFLAHYPPLKNNHIKSIIDWFLSNWKTDIHIKTIFDTARNYIHLEDDKNSTFKKITMKQDFIGALEFKIGADNKKYENSVLHSDMILRFTYYGLARAYLDQINNSYLNNETNSGKWIVEDLIKKIIKNGPDLTNELKSFEELQ